MKDIKRRIGSGVLLTLALSLFAGVLGARQVDETVREKVDVVEARTMVALPDLGRRQMRQLDASTFVVTESDELRESTRLEPIAPDGGPVWTVLLYFDLALSRAHLPALAAEALGEHAEQILDLGVVHTALGRVASVERLPIARDVDTLLDNLVEVAREERGHDFFRAQRVRATAHDKQSGRAYGREMELLRQRADLLIGESADVCDGGPCLLLLVSDGYDLAGEALAPGHAPEAAGFPQGADSVTEEVGRLLAGMGYTVIALPLVLPPEEAGGSSRSGTARGRAGTDYDAWKTDVAGGVRPLPGAASDLSARDLEPHVRPELEPLRRWADATAGTITAQVSGLDAAWSRLAELHWLYFRTERADEGELRPLEVRIGRDSELAQGRKLKKRLGLVPENVAIRSQAWSRSAYPRELAAARLRRLVLGERLERAVFVDTRRTDEVVELVWETPTPGRRARVTAIDRDGQIHHRVAETTAGDDRSRVELTAEERELPVLVQDLGSGVWGWTGMPTER